MRFDSKINVNLNKSRAYSDGVRLCLKNLEKIKNFEVYEGYTQVYNSEIDDEKFKRISMFDSLFDMYKALCGAKVLISLPSSKFSKVATYIKMAGGKLISAPEMDIIYKQTLSQFAEFDFYAFFHGCHQACLKGIKREGYEGLFVMLEAFEQTKAKIEAGTKTCTVSKNSMTLAPTTSARQRGNTDFGTHLKTPIQARPSSKSNVLHPPSKC